MWSTRPLFDQRFSFAGTWTRWAIGSSPRTATRGKGTHGIRRSERVQACEMPTRKRTPAWRGRRSERAHACEMIRLNVCRQLDDSFWTILCRINNVFRKGLSTWTTIKRCLKTCTGHMSLKGATAHLPVSHDSLRLGATLHPRPLPQFHPHPGSLGKICRSALRRLEFFLGASSRP